MARIQGSLIEEGMHFGLWWQCWLKVQEDLLAPQVQDTGPHVAWTSGLIYREGTVGLLLLLLPSETFCLVT
jgi:hypothetical protein